MSRPQRAALIGLDGANPEAIKPLLAEGLLPNIQKLLERGTLCRNAYAPFPTLTASNWASIATGAWPGRHGVTDMSYHVTGAPLDHWYSGFTSDAIEAETIWEAVARGSKKAIVMKYPGSWPPRDPGVILVDGGGGRPFWGGSPLELSHSQLVSNRPYPNALHVETTPASSWQGLPESSRPPLEFIVDYTPESGRIPEFLQFKGEPLRVGQPVALHGVLLARGRSGYDTLALARTRNFGTALAVLGAGDWSDSMELAFEIAGRRQRGSLRVILQYLDPEEAAFALYFSQVYPTDGFTQPAGVGRELVERFGAYINHPGFSESAMGWFGDKPETFLRLMEYQNTWLGRAGRHLMETREWDLFAMQCHCIDFANHMFVPRHGWTAAQREENLRHLARCYRSVDRMLGELLAGAGEECLVCVVSDHGATESPCPEVFVNPILEQAGLLFYAAGAGAEADSGVDLSRSLAVSQRAAFIYLNVRGREPGGVVPEEEYEATRDRVIDALRAYREPTTGRNPFALILRKEDARMLGLFDSLGRDIGDIVYALLPEFDHEHGRQLPAATLGGQTMIPLLLFSGPGINAGRVLERTAWLVDVAPTLAHAMRWPVPSEAEGAVLYQVFSEHATIFPRAESLKKQENNLRAASRPGGPQARPRPSSRPETAESEPRPGSCGGAGEEMPDDQEGLRAALLKARSEARKWQTMYEQYHRITHGN